MIFTMLPPHVQPDFQTFRLPSKEACYALVEKHTPTFEAVDGLIFSLKCEPRPRIEEEDGKVVPDTDPVRPPSAD